MPQGFSQNEGLSIVLNQLSAWATANNFMELRLFKNDFIPAVDSVIGDFVEANFSGYAAVILNSWVNIFGEPDGKRGIQDDPHTFVCNSLSSLNEIYGYYIVNNDEGRLMFAQRADGDPVPIEGVGDSYTVKPRIYAKDPSVA